MSNSRKASYCIPAIFKLRDKICDEIGLLYIGAMLERNCFAGFVDDLASLLPPGVQYRALFESVRYISGSELTKDNLLELAWRVAGNLPRLRAGKPTPPWTGQTGDELVPVQIIDSREYTNKYNQRGHIFSYRILAGSPCPLIIKKFWSYKFCRFICKTLGFTSPWRPMPFLDGSEFVGLRLTVLLDADKSEDAPFFDKITCPASHLKYNKTLLKLRCRTLTACPMGFSHPCYKCPIGYNYCPAATHALNYERRYCVHCNEESYFDPLRDTNKCVECDRPQPKEKKDGSGNSRKQALPVV